LQVVGRLGQTAARVWTGREDEDTMRARVKRRVAYSLLASAAVTGALAVVGVPAYGQQSAGVTNSGGSSANAGGNSSTGNSSSNAAGNATSATSTEGDLVGDLLGDLIGLNLGQTNGAANSSNGTSTVATGAAQASGNNSDTSTSQAEAGGGNRGLLGLFFGSDEQNAGVSNSGSASANTGGNTSTGNNSTNTASNNQNVTGGLINIGLSIGNTASNVSDGTSTIATGPATASGNQSTTAVDQTQVNHGGGHGPAGTVFGGPGRFGVGGADCSNLFGGGQNVNVSNSGQAAAGTGNNASTGNQSDNLTSNAVTGSGGTISIELGSLVNSAVNSSDGTSGIATGPATASGNQSTTAVSQECLEAVPVFLPGLRPGLPGGHTPIVARQGQVLARTGVDPFIVGLVAFSLLFAGLMFLVWERVETMPARRPTAA
jgi:hypothetical protein